jgi:hypothetical protein
MGWMTRAAALLAAGALYACGGGGGDGGGSSGPPQFAISADSVSFNAVQNGATPPPQTVTVSAVSGTTFVDVTQPVGLPFFSSFALTSPTTGTITITPLAPTSAGVQTGVITVRGCSVAACVSGDVPGSPKTITVTYTVVGPPTVVASPTFVSFQAGEGVAPPAQSVDVTSSGAAAVWNSTIAYTSGTPGWLTLTPATGTLPSSVSFQANAMPAGGYAATVTFDAGGLSTTVPVSLVVDPQGVNFVAPYVAATGQSGEVVIRGRGLDDPAVTVFFDTTPATSVIVDSDTQVRAVHPALVQGVYPVTVRHAGVPLPTRAQLVVVDAPAFAAAIVPRPVGDSSHVVNLVYDAERQAAFLLDADKDRLEAYRFDGANWVADTPRTFGSLFAGNWRLTLSPDGSELLKTNANSISRVDPANLALLSTEDAIAGLGTNPGLGFLVFANDGKAIGVSSSAASGVRLYGYDLLARTFLPLSTNPTVVNRLLVGPANASEVLFADLQVGFNPPILVYDAATGVLSPSSTNTGNVYLGAQNRSGSRTILFRSPGVVSPTCTVYDESLTALGTLPTTTLSNAVLSPDGVTAYVFVGGVIRKFDLTSPNGSGGFDEVGAGFPLLASPGTNSPAMALSPDGGTLFLAGNQNLIVMPAP